MAERLYTGIAVLDYNGDALGDSVLVDNSGSIAGVGPESRFKGVKRVRVDGYIIPGLVDAHMHLESLGISFMTVDLRGSRSPEEVARRLAASEGEVALGRGWDQESFTPRRMPSRRDLDRYVSDRPAVAVRVCGHMAVANSAALELTRPWEAYPQHVDRDSGLLVEDAVYYVLSKLRSRFDSVEAVKRASRMLAEKGVYGVSSMACSESEIRAIERLDASGELSVFVSCYASSIPSNPLSGERWTLAGVKLFADGSLGAWTARLSSDYNDNPGERGKLLLDSKSIAEAGLRVLGKGLRLAVHAIGDEALDHVIEAFERLGGGGRLRVEHASVARDSQIKALSDLGVWVVVQPRFRVSDWWIDRRLGAERVRLAYRFKSMIYSGVRLALSTDAPVEPYDPLETLKAAVGLCDQPACREEESLTPREALTGYTLHSALASGGAVSRLGTISRGRPAALALVSDDPTSATSLSKASIKGLLGALQS